MPRPLVRNGVADNDLGPSLCVHLSIVSLGDAGVKVRDVLTLTEADLPYCSVWGLREG